MLELTRTVRFCINDDPLPRHAPHNTFAAHPSMRGLGRYYELDITCRGDVDPATGYFINIKQIDQAVRSGSVPIIENACRERPGADAVGVLKEIFADLRPRLDGAVASIRWRLTPYYSIQMDATRTDIVLLRQQFEFAASHRLHSAALSDDQNRATFGKCNHPSGHGHNYRVEPCVEIDLGTGDQPPALSLADLERLTNQTLIERYDHKHLNIDTPEFACGIGDGVNPSVENIARECFRRLEPAIAQAGGPRARLRSVTVWETDKTSCTYPA